MLLPITRFIQYSLGTKSQWDTFNEIIPKGCCVICKLDSEEDLIFKIGDGTHKFIDLPIILYFKYINGAYSIKNINIDTNQIDHLLYINEDNQLTQTNFKTTDFVDLFNKKASANLGFTFIKPIINGPNKLGVNNTAYYTLDVYSIFNDIGDTISEIEWTLPNGTIITSTDSNVLTYQNDVDTDQIGNELIIKCRAKDKYNRYSRYTEKKIIVIDSGYDSYVLSSTIDI